MKLSVCTTDCECGKEIRSVVPWATDIRPEGAYIRCGECGNVVNATLDGQYNAGGML